MNYWYTSHDWDDDLCYDELSYFVFKNEKSAKKAFNTMKKNWIDRETDHGMSRKMVKIVTRQLDFIIEKIS